MGQRMPDEPHVYGDDCGVCFDAGKTPKYVYARFSLIKPCVVGDPNVCFTPPNDRMFKLTQHATISCLWRYEQSGWDIHYRARRVAPIRSYLALYDSNGRIYFYDFDYACKPEGFVYHNDWTECVGDLCAYGGIGVVTWTHQATELLASINMERAQNLFLEMRPLDNGKLVYKFCNLADATNIKFLFEP